jgi:hypothetical protein
MLYRPINVVNEGPKADPPQWKMIVKPPQWKLFVKTPIVENDRQTPTVEIVRRSRLATRTRLGTPTVEIFAEKSLTTTNESVTKIATKQERRDERRTGNQDEEDLRQLGFRGRVYLLSTV